MSMFDPVYYACKTYVENCPFRFTEILKPSFAAEELVKKNKKYYLNQLQTGISSRKKSCEK